MLFVSRCGPAVRIAALEVRVATVCEVIRLYLDVHVAATYIVAESRFRSEPNGGNKSVSESSRLKCIMSGVISLNYESARSHIDISDDHPVQTHPPKIPHHYRRPRTIALRNRAPSFNVSSDRDIRCLALIVITSGIMLNRDEESSPPIVTNET